MAKSRLVYVSVCQIINNRTFQPRSKVLLWFKLFPTQSNLIGAFSSQPLVRNI
jgi:hypothetical protein